MLQYIGPQVTDLRLRLEEDPSGPGTVLAALGEEIADADGRSRLHFLLPALPALPLLAEHGVALVPPRHGRVHLDGRHLDLAAAVVRVVDPQLVLVSLGRIPLDVGQRLLELPERQPFAEDGVKLGPPVKWDSWISAFFSTV